MLKIIFILTAVTILLFLGGCALLREGRAVWVVRFRLVDPGAITRIIHDAGEANLNTIFVQIHGRSDAFYRSDVDPKSETLLGRPPDYDPLENMVKAGRATGIEVHAWINAYYAWYPPPPLPLSPKHIVNRNPEWLIIDDNGRRIDDYSKEEMARKWVEGLYLDPARTEVLNYLAEVSSEVVRKYQVNGIHLDFIRYPGSGFGFNTRMSENFRLRHDVDPYLLSTEARSLKPDPSVWLAGKEPILQRWNHYYYSLWNAERARAISETVRRIYIDIKNIRPELTLSAAVLPDPDKAYYHFGQDWRKWLQEGYLDRVVPMAYFGGTRRVRAQLAAAASVAGPDKVYAGLGAWIKDSDVVSKEITVLRRLGIKGFSLFSYKGMTQKEGYLQRLKDDSLRRRFRLPVVRLSSGGRDYITAPPEGIAERSIWRRFSSLFSANEEMVSGRRTKGNHRTKDTDVALNSTDLLSAQRVEAKEIIEYLNALTKEFYTIKDFHNALNGLDLSRDELKKLLKKEIILYKNITSRCYQAAIPGPGERVSVPPRVNVSYILRSTHPKDSKERRIKAKKIIANALAGLDAGDDFSSMAKKYSQGGSARYGGKGGVIYYKPGVKLHEKIFSLDQGGHSDIIEGQYGFYIYKVNSFLPPFEEEFELLPPELRRRIFQERLMRLIENSTSDSVCTNYLKETG